MPGSVVNSLTTIFKISQAGNSLEFDVSEGEDVGLQVTLVSGAWTTASLSLKKSVAGGPPQAFSSAITIAADYNKQDIATENASRVVLTVDTAASTSESFAMVYLVCKGDRLASAPGRFTTLLSPAMDSLLSESNDFGMGGVFGP